MLEQAAVGLAIARPDGDVTLNAPARELLGLPAKASISSLPRPALVADALGGAAVSGALTEADGAGADRLLLISWSPLRDGDRVVGALGIVQDVSGKPEVDALPRPTATISDEFYAVIAHELRTPLTPILGWARMLLQQRPNDPVLRRAAEVIERNVRLEVRLVDDMLDVTRIQRGTLELAMRRLDINDVCRAVMLEQRQALGERSIALELTLAAEPLWVHGEASRLQQILKILVENGVRFTPDDGRVTLAAGREGAAAVCVITDTGEGIPPVLLGRLFDFNLKARHGAARATGGLGVCLAIARYIAERHGGTLEAASDGVGCGARFTLRLPPAPSS